MSSYTFMLICFQALLIQTAFSQVLGSRSGLDVEVDALSYGSAGLRGYGLSSAGAGLNSGIGAIGLGNGISGLGLNTGNFGNAGSVSSGFTGGYGFGTSDVAAIAALPVAGPYGGTGYGELAVGGEMGAGGNTIVTGQVPVLGAVSFGGNIPASGVVSLAGNCACGGVQL